MNKKEVLFTALKRIAMIRKRIANANNRQNDGLLSLKAWGREVELLKRSENEIRGFTLEILGNTEEDFKILENYSYISWLIGYDNTSYKGIRDLSLEEFEKMHGELK